MSGAFDALGFSLGYDPDPDGTQALLQQENLAREDRAESFFRNTASAFRRAGFADAAENLDQYLYGRGEPREFTEEQLARHPIFGAAEAANRLRFETTTFMGRSGPNGQQPRLLDLADGETLEFEDHWEKPIYRWLHNSMPSRGAAEEDPVATASDELYGGPATVVAFGQTGTRSRGRFTARRNGEDIEIGGTVQHGLFTGRNGPDSELFDFNPGTVGSEQAQVLERAGRAAPFHMSYSRLQDVHAQVERTLDGNLLLRSAIWGPRR